MSFGDRIRRLIGSHPETPVPAATSGPVADRRFSGPFISPGWPITPVEENVVGQPTPRYFDYVSGVNSNVIPRTEYNGIIPDFGQLWNAYLLMPIMRVAVTFRCQQILSLGWKLKQRKGTGSQTGKDGPEELLRLFERPDPQNNYNFEQWMRSCLEEIYVTDALTLFPVKSKTGRVVSFMQIDGQTIKPLIDYERGGIPVPPVAAFLQYIKGTAFRSFTADQLIYRPFRPRSWCIYGQSRVEAVLATASLYQLHENWASDFFTQGNIPETLYLLDADQVRDWDPKKFKEWQDVLDQVSGINPGRRRVHLAPPFVKDAKTLKEFHFERELPDWLVRLICIEFGVPSYLFTSETNRATAKEMNEALFEAPLRMDLMSMKRLMDELAEIAGFPEMEFEWAKEYDYRKESVEGIVLLTTPSTDGQRVMSIEEARLNLGLEEGEGEEGNGQPSQSGGEDDGSDPDATAQNGGADAASPNAADENQPAKAAGNVVSIKATTSPAIGRRRGRRFIGSGAAKKARLATGLAPVVLKRLRQQQAEIVKQALELAHARAKKVEGV